MIHSQWKIRIIGFVAKPKNKINKAHLRSKKSQNGKKYISQRTDELLYP